jgi:hypothetical protein
MRGTLFLALAGISSLLTSCGPSGNGNQNGNGNRNDNSSDGATEFRAILTGAAERPEPVKTATSGEASFELKADGLVYVLTVNDGIGIIQAHIHLGGPEDAGGVVAFLFGPVDGMDVDGLLAEGTLEGADLVGELRGGTLDDLLQELRDGNAYVNVHSVEFQAVEVRGQIVALEE